MEPLNALLAQADRLLRERRFRELEPVCRQILAGDPRHPVALQYLGLVAMAAHRLDPARAFIERAVAARPRDFACLNSLGLVLQAQGDHAGALKAFRRVVAARPDDADAHANLGSALRDTGSIDAASASFGRAIALDHDHADGNYGRALCLLLQGQPDDAWAGHEWRVASRQFVSYAEDPRSPGRCLPRPSTWCHENPDGRALLVLGEQGLGDELFFLRFAVELLARGLRIAYRGSPRLVPLLRGSALADCLVAVDAPLPHADHALLVGDLPLVCAASRPPGFVAPLRWVPSAQARELAAARLSATGPGPYLGVTWRAGRESVPGEARTLAKAISPDLLGRSLAGWRGTIVILQRDPRPDEIGAFVQASGVPTADLSDLHRDLPVLAAVLGSIDEHVGVSSTNMHLRAGAGRAAHVLVPAPPEWRWLAEGNASPWFPGFAVYRQSRGGSWAEALRALAARLGNASGGRQPA
jgi:Tfp pilus assembly protein PilF